MGPDRRQQAAPEQPDDGLELQLVREVVLARRRLDNVVLAALTLGAELLDHDSERATAMRAAQILEQHAVDEVEISRDPRAALRTDMIRDRDRARRIGLVRESWHPVSEDEQRRRKQAVLLCEVRADLLEVVRDCGRVSYDRIAFADGIAKGLCAATDKLVEGADMETYRAWQRGMVLKLSEVPAHDDSPAHVMATVDAGPGLEPLTVEWDSPERRLALVARMARAGISPIVICDRLLADLSVSSPLRYSVR
ncbi:hypothetical protein [Nocardia sp. NBC_01327]|uniref:hypothetical protein n=1 Tax=Nocardia sp. NBC_01327 TaxID=2903593 RepID=UPI002E11017E|nr:hypothetical protein OG326_04875 [Nocardia sp. NBC_01327]